MKQDELFERQFLQTIRQSKPTISIRPEFKQELRQQLLQKHPSHTWQPTGKERLQEWMRRSALRRTLPIVVASIALLVLFLISPILEQQGDVDSMEEVASVESIGPEAFATKEPTGAEERAEAITFDTAQVAEASMSSEEQEGLGSSSVLHEEGEILFTVAAQPLVLSHKQRSRTFEMTAESELEREDGVREGVNNSSAETVPLYANPYFQVQTLHLQKVEQALQLELQLIPSLEEFQLMVLDADAQRLALQTIQVNEELKRANLSVGEPAILMVTLTIPLPEKQFQGTISLYPRQENESVEVLSIPIQYQPAK